MPGLSRLGSPSPSAPSVLGTPFPPLDHHLRVSVTEAGLVVSSTKQHSACILEWGQHGSIAKCPLPQTTEQESTSAATSTEARGLVGILRLFSQNFLVLVIKTELAATLPAPTPSSSQHAATSAGRRIWAIRQVLAVPLDRQAATDTIQKHNRSNTDSACSSSDEESEMEADEVQPTASAPTPPSQTLSAGKEKGSPFAWSPFRLDRYADRFAASKAPEQQARVPSSTSPKKHKSAVSVSAQDQQSRSTLDHRIVTELSREMRHGMYLSYDFDPTHGLQAKSNALREGEAVLSEPLRGEPFWKRADKRFWWNRWMSLSLVEAKLDGFVYPIFQGFVEQIESTLPLPAPSTSADASTSQTDAPPNTVDVTLSIISRRSIERPGLRYQRRGVNTRGGVANFVETEFVTQVDVPALQGQEKKSHVTSFIQTRGSIPLFWSQSPWALKPPPVLERTEKENSEALQKHFEALKGAYGPQVVINLAEQSGKEGAVVQAYRSHVEGLQDADVKYVDFDFHHECRGMAYENISVRMSGRPSFALAEMTAYLKKLRKRIEGDLKQQNFFWTDSTMTYTRQAGACRVNCMDCLDRTNVVQSAIARAVLASTLVRLGLPGGMAKELDREFNELWASNGDAISLEYAGTSALKGDFTRTGKRDFRGMFNDATNSVARLFQNTILDFFKQAMIDYVLGVNVHAFAEFQDKLATSDPGRLHLLATIRRTAIDTCTSLLLSEREKKLQDGFEEKVVLLSDQAMYVVSYEYNLDKVREFAKIPLDCITGIQRGTLILSTLNSFARDPEENYGFILSYRLVSHDHSEQVQQRMNTYSLDTIKGQDELAQALREAAEADMEQEEKQLEQKMIFKHMRKDIGNHSVETGDDEPSLSTGEEAISAMVEAIATASRHSKSAETASLPVEVKAIRSLEEAQASETLFARLLHSVEKYIWL